MEAKPTPETKHLDLTTVRADVAAAYNSTPAAATIQPVAATSGKAHPGRVAMEPVQMSKPDVQTSTPSASESQPKVQGLLDETGIAEVHPPIIGPHETPPSSAPTPAMVDGVLTAPGFEQPRNQAGAPPGSQVNPT